MHNYKIIKNIKLKTHHKPTGNTKHFRWGKELSNEIWELKIIKIDPEPGFYLIYFDSKANELTDTLHDSLEAAMQQAEFEFNVKQNEWEDCK